MKIIYTFHWRRQKRFRLEITDDLIEMCIINSDKLKDRKWDDAYNAISRIPPSGRILKVVYRERFDGESKTIKIITACWLD
ncbi:hypothetical protein CMI42_00530 [Candidatus Pacearchaeota archaeon]|nr:hypothetical protein [Candidatus Pacearchaeota archaeon]|tara:strand:- start:2702 stop:2944 length:243 start_codon:yes stop_codon:yes gene_type:complete